MTRDMDLIRKILLEMEASKTDVFIMQQLVEIGDPEQIMGHVHMLISGGFLTKSDKYSIRMSWSGYEFLDNIRDPEIWRKTKEGAQKVGSWSVKLLADLASGFIRTKAIELGLPIAL